MGNILGREEDVSILLKYSQYLYYTSFVTIRFLAVLLEVVGERTS